MQGRFRQDQQLSQLAWAFASAGVRREEVMGRLAGEVLRRDGFQFQAEWAADALGWLVGWLHGVVLFCCLGTCMVKLMVATF